jgi:hypothetical protein
MKFPCSLQQLTTLFDLPPGDEDRAPRSENIRILRNQGDGLRRRAIGRVEHFVATLHVARPCMIVRDQRGSERWDTFRGQSGLVE